MQKQNPEFRRTEKASNNLLAGGQFAIGFLVGFLATVFIFFGISVFGFSWTRSELIELGPAMVALIVASTSLVLTFIALEEQRKIRQAGSDPVLVAHLAQRSDEPFVVHLAISNIGAGAAMNVKVEFDHDYNEADQQRLLSQFMRSSRFINVILQGSAVEYVFGTGEQLLLPEPLQACVVRLSYQDISGAVYASSHRIDVSELDDRPSNAPATTRIWREIEKIGKSIETIRKGFSKET